MSLIQELQRRNVIRVGLAYAAAGWLLIQLAEIVFEAWAIPEVGLRVLITVLAIGLPLVLVFAWAFELTPEGLKRESEIDRSSSIAMQTGRRLDRIIIVVLALALGYFAVDKFVLRDRAPERVPPAESSAVEAAREQEAAGEQEPDGDIATSDEAPALPTDRSVAVLPLRNLGQAGEGDAFATGMHDGLLTALAQIDSLRVVARASVLRIADQGLSLPEVAGLLGVATVLEGGVQRAGDQLRVSLQLVDAASESYLWAETFDRRLTADNVFAVQSDIARAVSEALQVTLTAGDEQRLARLPTENLAALEAYFEGRALLDQRTERAIQAAREAFRNARERDPDFAQALAGEALAILLLRQGPATYGDIPRVEAVAMASPLLERAAELAPDDAEVLAVRGLLAYDALQLEESVELLRRSLEINPANGPVMGWLVNSLSALGRFDEATDVIRASVERDPSSKLAVYNAAVRLTTFQAAEPGEVDALLARLARLDPVWHLYARAGIHRIHGERVEAFRLGLEILERDSGFTQARDYLAFMLLELGLVEEARAMAATLPEAEIALASGDVARALALAQAGFEANPTDEDAVILLARSLAAAQQWDETLRLAQVIWEATGRNPYGWPPEALADVTWLARLTERTQVFEEFYRASREAYAKSERAGLMNAPFQFAGAKLALIEGEEDRALQRLARAIDLGLRDLGETEASIWDPLRDRIGFTEQLDRLEKLRAEERRAVRDMLCGPDAIMTWREPAPETCEAVAGETASAR